MKCEHDQKRYGLFGLPKEANGCLACAYEQSVARLIAYEVALNEIASWREGPVVSGSFDEPGAAERARAALVCPWTSRQQVDTVGGIECAGYQGRHPTNLDTDPVTLLPCPFCGKQAAYREGEQRGDTHPIAVECVNTSCGVKTPKHYADRVTAARAWNRRVS